jgi:hypothetical protein
MGKIVKYFLVALAAAAAALGLYHVVRGRKLECDCMSEGETFEDDEPCGCCGAEFSEPLAKEESSEEKQV